MKGPSRGQGGYYLTPQAKDRSRGQPKATLISPAERGREHPQIKYLNI